jgi:hypothetical protein
MYNYFTINDFFILLIICITCRHPLLQYLQIRSLLVAVAVVAVRSLSIHHRRIRSLATLSAESLPDAGLEGSRTAVARIHHLCFANRE